MIQLFKFFLEYILHLQFIKFFNKIVLTLNTLSRIITDNCFFKTKSFKNVDSNFIEKIVKKEHLWLQQYKDLYKGKEIALVACGGTVENYCPINNVIHVGVNRAFRIPDINFDYLFIQDWFPEGFDELEKYQKNNTNCKTIYGYIPKSRIEVLKPFNIKGLSYSFIKSRGEHYFLSPNRHKTFEKDLAHNPLTDFAGTVFSALQFIIYTNPTKIYLVGCDCSNLPSEHSFQKTKITYSGQIKNWVLFKEFVENNYPNTEVISINPVGLKGLFKDVYTNELVESGQS